MADFKPDWVALTKTALTVAELRAMLERAHGAALVQVVMDDWSDWSDVELYPDDVAAILVLHRGRRDLQILGPIIKQGADR